MLTAMIDLLMKKFENPGLDHLKTVDARVMCEECGEMGHMGINCRRSPRTSTLLVIPTMVFILIKASMLGGTNPVSRSTTTNKVVWDITSTEVNLLSRNCSGSAKD
jgi:hypothetical protein